MPPARKKSPPKKVRPKKISLMAKMRRQAGKFKPARKPPKKSTRRAGTARTVKAVVRKIPIAKSHAPIEKHPQNPIIEPRTHVSWESKAAFNPGAVEAGGKIHLLYRAIGDQDISVVGYAALHDGVNIHDRADEPAYIPRLASTKAQRTVPRALPNGAYSSGGGGWGGSEDPRATRLEDNIYLTYTAFDGWGSVRVTLASISVKDFLEKRWNWSEPIPLSPPGEVHKNWVLFPEKIHGKYAILHSVSPKVLVDYIDDLDEFQREDRSIKSNYDRHSGTGGWDDWVRGIGPPPIKTKDGWLLLYHAMDTRDPNRYKLGAMLVDLDDPTKILYRAQSPILEPEEWYENTGWKSGVVYCCGAVVKDGTLFIYYGGADSVVCVATADIDKFLDHLKKYGTAKLQPEEKARTAARK
jgi:predicted GH43/DUF377 family glycosyl hydrolase